MLDGMIITKLKKIDDSKGSVMHFLKKNENSFLEFGEAYFSLVNRLKKIRQLFEIIFKKDFVRMI